MGKICFYIATDISAVTLAKLICKQGEKLDNNNIKYQLNFPENKFEK